MKRLLDTLLALVALIALSPVFFLTALFVFLDDGFPIFFRQTRLGLGGREFNMLSFAACVKMLQPSGPISLKPTMPA